MSYRNALLIVPEARADLARSLAVAAATANGTPDSAVGMWESRWTKGGQNFRYSAGPISGVLASLLGDAPATHAATGGAASLADIQALYAESVIVLDLTPQGCYTHAIDLGYRPAVVV